MKRIDKIMMVAGSIIAFSFSAWAQQCVSLPTCDELGYSQTSCPSGTPSLKCPFDTTKLFCGGMSTPENTGPYSHCAIGNIFYTDGTCSTDPVTGKTPVGIIGSPTSIVSLTRQMACGGGVKVGNRTSRYPTDPEILSWAQNKAAINSGLAKLNITPRISYNNPCTDTYTSSYTTQFSITTILRAYYTASYWYSPYITVSCNRTTLTGYGDIQNIRGGTDATGGFCAYNFEEDPEPDD